MCRYSKDSQSQSPLCINHECIHVHVSYCYISRNHRTQSHTGGWIDACKAVGHSSSLIISFSFFDIAVIKSSKKKSDGLSAGIDKFILSQALILLSL